MQYMKIELITSYDDHVAIIGLLKGREVFGLKTEAINRPGIAEDAPGIPTKRRRGSPRPRPRRLEDLVEKTLADGPKTLGEVSHEMEEAGFQGSSAAPTISVMKKAGKIVSYKDRYLTLPGWVERSEAKAAARKQKMTNGSAKEPML